MDKSLIALVSENELKMADHYVNAYAVTDGAERTASIEYLLREWDNSKSQYLSKMFGDNLILSRDVEIARDKNEMGNDIARMWRYDPMCARFQNEFYEKIVNPLTMNWNNKELCAIGNKIESLMYWDSLIDNVYSGETFEIGLPILEKPFKVQHGCKTLKTIGKLVSLCGLNQEYFEAFRIAHSQILNQKTFKGTLCLSIHPLDYMTMSDNECDWSSCMSWENGGCYRQGTVEMMNSSCVVIAYLKSSEDMLMPSFFGSKYSWNSKKWRELYIVTPKMISNIKGYPYQNDYISKYVLNWLKELAENADVGTYGDTIISYNSWSNFTINDNISVSIDPSTGYMYNDFNSSRTQFGFFSTSMEAGSYRIRYSGLPECMACGNLDVYCSSEGNLIGECCERYYECEECGEHYYSEDDLTDIDGYLLCPHCLETCCEEDSFMGDLHLEEDTILVHLMSGNRLYRYETVNLYKHHLNGFSSDYIKKFFPRLYRATNAFDDNNLIVYVKAEELTENGWDVFGYDNLEAFNSSRVHEYDYEVRDTTIPEIEVKKSYQLLHRWKYKENSVYVMNL